MSELELQAAVMLLLVDRMEYFRSSYFLIQILSRKFDVLDIGPVEKHLMEKRYIERAIIRQVAHYSATTEGKGYLVSNEVLIRKDVERLFPDGVIYLEKLWSAPEV